MNILDGQSLSKKREEKDFYNTQKRFRSLNKHF